MADHLRNVALPQGWEAKYDVVQKRYHSKGRAAVMQAVRSEHQHLQLVIPTVMATARLPVTAMWEPVQTVDMPVVKSADPSHHTGMLLQVDRHQQLHHASVASIVTKPVLVDSQLNAHSLCLNQTHRIHRNYSTRVVIDLIFTAHELISISKDGTVAFWELSSGECTRNLDVSCLNPGANTRLHLSGDGRRLVVDSDAINSAVHIFDMKTGQLLHKCGRRLPTQRRSFLVGNLLCRQKNIIDVRTGRVVKTLDDFVQTKRYVTCCITPDQHFILIGEEMVTKLFDFERGTLLATYPSENLPCVFVVSEDNRQVYVGYVEDCIFKVFDIDMNSPNFGSVVSVFNYRTAMPGVKLLDGPPHGRELCEIALNPVDRDVVLLNIRRTNLIRYNIAKRDAKLIDVKSLNVTNRTFLFGATFSYNGKYVVVGEERFVHVWNAESSMHFLCTINLHSTAGFPLSISQTRCLVATASTIHTAIKVWDLDKLDVADVVDGAVYECPVDSMACSTERRLVFVKTASKALQFVDSFGIDIWNASSGNTIPFLPFGRYGKLLQMEVSSDGYTLILLLSTRDTYIAVINLRTNKIQHELQVTGCTGILLSPNSDYICTSSAHDAVKQLQLWSVRSGEQLVCFYHASKPVFTLDCQYLLYIDSGQTLITYSLSRMAPMRYLSCHAQHLLVLPVKHHLILMSSWTSAAFSPQVTVWDFHDSQQVLSLSEVAAGGIQDVSKDGELAVDSDLQVFDLNTGELKCRINHDSKDLTFVRLTDDGVYVVWVEKLSVRVSRVSDGALIAHTCTHERTTSLCSLDCGYIQVVGREDGRILMMMLVADCQQQQQHYHAALQPRSLSERCNVMLSRQVCSDKVRTRFDAVYQLCPHSVKDTELLRASEHIRNVLIHRAKAPLLSTAMSKATESTADKYRRSYSQMTPIGDLHVGSLLTGASSYHDITSTADDLSASAEHDNRRSNSVADMMAVCDIATSPTHNTPPLPSPPMRTPAHKLFGCIWDLGANIRSRRKKHRRRPGVADRNNRDRMPSV